MVIPFSRGPSQPRDQTAALAGGFFTTSATWEALMVDKGSLIKRKSYKYLNTSFMLTSGVIQGCQLPHMGWPKQEQHRPLLR